jgi:hypothetical protein
VFGKKQKIEKLSIGFEKIYFLFYGDFGMFLAYNLNYHFRIVCGIMPL